MASPSNSTSGMCRGKTDPKPPCSASPSLQRHKTTEARASLCLGCAAAIIFQKKSPQHPTQVALGPFQPHTFQCIGIRSFWRPSANKGAGQNVYSYKYSSLGQALEKKTPTFIPSSCTFLPFSFLLHWKNAIFLIIKVKVVSDLAGRSYRYLPAHVLLQPCHKNHNLPNPGTNFYLNRNRPLNNMCFTGHYFVFFFSCPDKKNNVENKTNRRHRGHLFHQCSAQGLETSSASWYLLLHQSLINFISLDLKSGTCLLLCPNLRMHSWAWWHMYFKKNCIFKGI